MKNLELIAALYRDELTASDFRAYDDLDEVRAAQRGEEAGKPFVPPLPVVEKPRAARRKLKDLSEEECQAIGTRQQSVAKTILEFNVTDKTVRLLRVRYDFDTRGFVGECRTRRAKK